MVYYSTTVSVCMHVVYSYVSQVYVLSVPLRRGTDCIVLFLDHALFMLLVRSCTSCICIVCMPSCSLRDGRHVRHRQRSFLTNVYLFENTSLEELERDSAAVEISPDLRKKICGRRSYKKYLLRKIFQEKAL